jgi:PhzF family phenazine biosynthesis protein
MPTLPFTQVDAFAHRTFTGNPAAVMPLESWLDDSVLQAIAEENNLSETAFIVPDATDAADYELRWFTPTAEVRMCGHATLASGHVVLSNGLGIRAPLAHSDQVRFSTRKVGVLTVERTAIVGQSGLVEQNGDAQNHYALSLPAIESAPMDFPEAAKAMGGAPIEIYGNPDQYYLVRYATAAEVLALAPDMKALALVGNDLFAATAPGLETDIISRVFVPGAGIDEDPVTGSAHALLAPYWAKILGKHKISAYQASRRGGHVGCEIKNDRVILTGGCVTTLTGQMSF